MSNSLQPRVPLEMGALSDPAELGRMLAASGYFSDVKDAAQAVVKVLAGRELGIPPIAAMTGVFIVKGRVTLGANLIAALIKRHPRYDLRVVELTDERCEIAFLQDGEPLGSSEFTMDDARKAGLRGDNWTHYPRNMLFARAVSNGAKWFVPDVFAGAPIYTPDELGAETDPETGEVVINLGVAGAGPDERPGMAGQSAGAHGRPPQVIEPAPKRKRKPKPEPEPAPTTEVAAVDQETGEVFELRPDETHEAPVNAVTAGAGSTESPAPADGSDPITSEQFATLVEYLDRLEVPDVYRQLAVGAAGVASLSQLTKDQARDLMTKAKARYG